MQHCSPSSPSRPTHVGRHSFCEVRCGDYREILNDVKADLIFTSPPYNIGSRGKRKDGYRKLGKFDPKSFGGITGYPDKIPEDEYQNQQEQFLLWAADHLQANGTLVYNHKPRRNGHMIHPGEWFLRSSIRAHGTFARLRQCDRPASRGGIHNGIHGS